MISGVQINRYKGNFSMNTPLYVQIKQKGKTIHGITSRNCRRLQVTTICLDNKKELFFIRIIIYNYFLHHILHYLFTAVRSEHKNTCPVQQHRAGAICAWLLNPRDMRRVGLRNKTINTSKSFPLLKVGINKVFKMVGCYNVFSMSIRNKPLDLLFWNVAVFSALTKKFYDCYPYIIDLVVESD